MRCKEETPSLELLAQGDQVDKKCFFGLRGVAFSRVPRCGICVIVRMLEHVTNVGRS